VHGLGQRRAAAHVFHEPQDFHPVLGFDPPGPRQKFPDVIADIAVFEIMGERHRGDNAAGDIVRETGNFINVACDIVLGRVRQQGIRIVGPGRRLESHRRAGDGAAVNGFRQMHHLRQFFPDMAGRRRSLVFCRQGRRADQNIGDAAFAAAVILAMQGGEPFDKQSGHIVFAAQEDTLPGNKDIVKDNHGLAAHHAEAGIAGVRAFLHFALLVGLTAENQRHARRVEGQRAGHRIVPVGLFHRLRRHDQDFMRIDAAGHVHLRAADHDAVGPPFDDVRKQIRIGLLGRRKRAVAFRIGHSAHHHHVGFLNMEQVLFKPLEVIGGMFLIRVVGGHIGGVERVKADAALEARSRFVGNETHHQNLLDQIVDALMNVGKPVDLLSAEVRDSRHQVFVFRPQGQLIRERRRIDVRLHRRMPGHIFHALSVVINDASQILKALHIILPCNDALHTPLLQF